MSDIIKLLPDSVANQIAAGEVIQRPSSVVKELMENAIDAGATEVKVVIKDAGSTLIQIIDNGGGMSEMDARMAFERHATSKISDSQDLFNLSTNGFRGEALASIAAVAQVELKTKRADEELGTQILISGSVLEKQEDTMCADGTNMMVRNLFYNVPARRRFLKKNEFTYIDNDFKRIALTYPEVAMSLTHNDNMTHNLPSSNLLKRVVNLFGKTINSKLVSVESDTSIAKITGFVGTPESAKKTRGEQYFFVNGRYMKHPYFHRSVMEAYGRLLPADTFPSYFVFFEVEPGSIDVNVHPQKVEIKFENERAIFPILMATVKEAIGKFSLAPRIDFDQEDAPEIPVFDSSVEVKVPKVKFNSNFNPFKSAASAEATPSSAWDQLYEEMPQNTGFLDDDTPVVEQTTLDIVPVSDYVLSDKYTQLFKKFILVESDRGVLLINQKRAHERIIYEEVKEKMADRKMVSQKLIFPETMQFDSSISTRLEEIQVILADAGFHISVEGGGKFEVLALPSEIADKDGVSIIEQILEKAEVIDLNDEIRSMIAETLSVQGAVASGQELSVDEMKNIVGRLVNCETPYYTPKGTRAMAVLSEKELSNLI